MSSLVQSSAAVEFLGDASSKNLSLTGVTSGNSILVGVAVAVFTGIEPVFTVSDGSSYAEDVAVWFSTAASQRVKVGIYRLHGAASGAHTISVSFTGPSAANVYGAVRAHEISGLQNSNADKTMSGTGNSNTPVTGASGALSQADNFVFGCVMTEFAGIDTPTNFTNVYLDNSTSGVSPNSQDYRVISNAASLTIGWGTLDVSGDWGCVGAVYKNAVGAQGLYNMLKGM